MWKLIRDIDALHTDPTRTKAKVGRTQKQKIYVPPENWGRDIDDEEAFPYLIVHQRNYLTKRKEARHISGKVQVLAKQRGGKVETAKKRHHRWAP